MSIENRIKALELAIQRHAGNESAPVLTTAETFFNFLTGTKQASATVSQPVAPTQAAVPQPPPAAQTANTPAAPAVSYETHLAPKITAVAAVAKSRMLELLAEYGAKRGPEVKASDYVSFYEKLTKLHDEVVKKAA